MAENLKNKAVKGVIWSFVDQFSIQIIQFVISIILARLLLPTDYGLVGMLAFFMAIACVFIDGGFASALIQRKDRTDRDLNTVFYINVGMSVLFYGILALSAPWIAEFYNQSELVLIIRIYCLSLIIGALSGINNVLLTINVDYKTKSKISVIASLTSGIIGIASAFLGCGVWALVIQSLSSSALSTIINFYFVRWFPKLEFSRDSFRNLFGYGSKLLVSSVIASAYTNIYSLVIGKQFSPAILGYFARAKGFTSLTVNNVNNIVSRVSFPILSQIQDNDEALIGVYKKYIGLSSFLIFPMVLLLCGISKPLILFLLTDKWAMSIDLLQILCFGSMWDAIIDVNLNLLKVKGRTDLVLKLEIIKKAIAFTILGISIFFDNIYAVCIGSTFYGFIALYLNTIYSKKLIDFGIIKQFKLFAPYLYLSLFIMGIALIFSHFIEKSLVSLIASCIICPVIYFYLARKCKLEAYFEFMQIIKPYLNKFKRNNQTDPDLIP